MGRLNPSLDLSISHRAVSEIFPDRLLFVPCTPLRERESSSCAACREVHPTSACTCTWTRTCMYNIWQKKRRWLSPHRTSALMCERKLCGRQGLRTIGPTVDLPANMQEGKRRSLRSQAAPPGAVAVNGMVGGVAEHSGVCGVPGLESLHSLSSRSSTASPTPTVGTAIGSHGATSPASEVVAPQQRLRRPMNSFLLYSNEHRKTRLLTSARHVARPAPFVLSRGCTRRSGMVSCTLSASPPPPPPPLSAKTQNLTPPKPPP